MNKIDRTEIATFIETHINDYHEKILQRLRELSLVKILKRKNPYLFKVKALNTAQDLVQSILDAHLSSQEEGIFGGFLEELAIFICGRVYDGKKSSAEGIDLEFEKDGIRYIISIKSGPNWGNSGQIAKMKDQFRKAKRILQTNISKTNVVAVNGCCYGKDERPDKGEYLKLCGQRFWELISGDEHLYTEIIEPLGWSAKERTAQFQEEYAKVINRFTIQFAQEYCDETGAINWEKLVRFNSGKKN
ncbi:cytosolic protein [candidate division KSB3 bacterium]|uniref:Cytosolic protein n=1 Tax=candidate division KSB3 bacterium TaxID=2044937 RepID=A0A9D5JW92_9BACT|nr:cytosolic protein [candidate division KSB3 bacterium]MBD3325300.1 cytosolic protein [candidate division KSB3 bacterium]